jgi:hypothetical protein
MDERFLLSDLERLLRDPNDRYGVVEFGSTGVWVANLRNALLLMDYRLPHAENSSRFDAELRAVLLQFQTEMGHPHKDGRAGPGTRELLVKKLFERGGALAFERLRDPERRNEGHAFVSYARADRSRIEEYVEVARQLRFQLWFDSNLPGGVEWEQMLYSQIANAYLVVVFVSDATAASQWVGVEVERAIEAGKPILPVLLDKPDRADPLYVRLRPWQALDASGATEFERATWLHGAFRDALVTAHGKQFV